MSLDTFYENLSGIKDFHLVAEGDIYESVPDNWWVVVGDIRNSTQAIEKGLYKEVNMAGATIIAAVSNLYKKFGQLPYAFGGDGAFFLVPDYHIQELKKTLSFCRKAIAESFGLDMRVGIIQMKEIREAGYRVKVAKLKLSPYMSQAVFWGEGLSYAEDVIKQREIAEEESDYEANLEGLECRWQEIPSRDEEITSYIIKARGKTDKEKSEIYAECLKKIDQVYGSISERNPVSIKKLKLTKSWKKLQTEWKIRTWKPTLKRKISYAAKLIYESIAGGIVMKNSIQMRGVNWGNYKSDFLNHVDFRKFDESLRFVASGTADERLRLEKYLEEKLGEGKLHYGIHSSESLIITCYISNHEKEHIHFIDGIDGGYAMAAQKIKQQMKISA